MSPLEPAADEGAAWTARESARQAQPPVSVILVVRNEEKHLAAAIDGVLAQDYAGEFEVVVAVGPSGDRTREIADELAAGDPRIHVVDNPTGRTPAGLNTAIAAARHDVLVRVDGHSELSDGYIGKAVRLLHRTGAANVGGRMVPVGVTPFEQAVARAMSTPLGIGSAQFHTGGDAGPAPTVYLGAFRRDALEAVGGYDEHFTRAQDWELNHRLRRAGETVWFDPELAVTYRPRGSWKALARQFFHTGQWRRQVIATYPETAGARYLAPPALVVGLAASVACAAVGAVVDNDALRAIGWLAPAYGVAVIGGSVLVSARMPASARAVLPLVVATMHVAWGLGFLRGGAATGAGAPLGSHYSGSAAVPDAAAGTPSSED